jgi:hypothetical protein
MGEPRDDTELDPVQLALTAICEAIPEEEMSQEQLLPGSIARCMRTEPKFLGNVSKKVEPRYRCYSPTTI